ncbi:hypothetical protein PHMEG_0004111 [Phytophthora megakarya]|uniref:Uncharacterized protein n=1 Tax=Phytophthora megakarya TaxID=4795 RepID=A0A225WW78_9STRA|nr:hypothetical protein PHMEG_0004111 [Phytophthora megakarya]
MNTQKNSRYGYLEQSATLAGTADVLLGMPWFIEVNPAINSAERVICPRPQGEKLQPNNPLQFHQCSHRQQARRVAGRRIKVNKTVSQASDASSTLHQYYIQHGHRGSQGLTRFISSRDIKTLFRAKTTSIVFLWPQLQATLRLMQRSVHWRILLYTRSSIAIEIEFFAPNYQMYLPPSSHDNMDASIEVADSTPVHRKQFPLSPEQKAAIQE